MSCSLSDVSYDSFSFQVIGDLRGVPCFLSRCVLKLWRHWLKQYSRWLWAACKVLHPICLIVTHKSYNTWWQFKYKTCLADFSLWLVILGVKQNMNSAVLRVCHAASSVHIVWNYHVGLHFRYNKPLCVFASCQRILGGVVTKYLNLMGWGWEECEGMS